MHSLSSLLCLAVGSTTKRMSPEGSTEVFGLDKKDDIHDYHDDEAINLGIEEIQQ